MPDAHTPRDLDARRDTADVRDAGSHAGAPTTRTVHDEQPIDLLHYIARLGRFLVPAAVLGLLTAVVVAVALGYRAPKVTYHTKAHVMVQPSSTNMALATAQSQLSSQYMRTYVALGSADILTHDVAAALHGKYTPQQVAQMMQVYWGGGSMLLAVQATSTSHQDALAISEAGAKALVAHQAQLLNMPAQNAPRLTLVQDAFDDTPATTGGGGHLRGVVPGIAAGVIMTLLAAMVLEWLAGRRSRRPHPAATAR